MEAPLSQPMAPARVALTTIETAAIVGSASTSRRRLGDSDLHVFPLALGGNVFGWTADATATRAILDGFADRGGNFIDTADSYAAGRSESMIGSWMRERRNRDHLVIATKVGKGAEHPGLSSRAIAASVDASLRRLGTDRIDLLYLHLDDPEVPFEETLLAVDELIRSGRVLHFGASHHTGERLIEARIASAQLGVAPMLALQNEYNLMARREYEAGLANVAARQGLAVIPRFALAGGYLSGKYRSRADLTSSARGPEMARYARRHGHRVLAALDRVAAAHDANVATIALAWLMSKPNVVAPVASVSRPDQLFDLMAAAEVSLTRHELALLDHASA
jgi:aryl-alcohol dehydrogenase-like predicted oxidoreductase